MVLSNASIALLLVVVTCVTASSVVRSTVEESATNTTASENSTTRSLNVIITDYQNYIVDKKIFLWREWDVEGVIGGMVGGFGLTTIGIVLYRIFYAQKTTREVHIVDTNPFNEPYV